MRHPIRLALVLAALATLLLPDLAAAQDLHPSRRPSPMGVARVKLGDGAAYVKVVYSRPYERGRDNVFGTVDSGALVPYGKLWRTGANEATEITTTADLTFGGVALPAGTYSLFTTPGAERWTVHVNSAVGGNGTQGYDAANDVVAVEVVPGACDEEVDQFTISFDSEEGGGTDLVLAWITTEVRVPIAVAE